MRFILAFTFALFIFVSPAEARNKLLDIQEVTSPGGIKAWLVEDHSVPVIAMEYAFKDAGTVLDPPDKQGLARMLSNTMDEGAGDLDSQSFQKELQDLSISLFFSVSRDYFSGSLKTLRQNKGRAFELLQLALTRPRFDVEAVDRMRASNQSRIRASLSDPDWIAARIMNDTAFAGHPYAMNGGGTLSGLQAITSDDLQKFHGDYLGKNNLSVAVAGDITKEELAQILDQVFGALPEINPPAPIPDIAVQSQGKTTLYSKDIPQTIFRVLQPGIDHKSPDYQIAQVMNFILGESGFGSRLTKEIREKRGLTYGIYSDFENMAHFDGLSVSTSTENKNAGEMLSLIKTEWEKMKTTPVTAEELGSAKSYLIGSLPLSLTSTDKIAGLLLGLQLDERPIDYLDQREKSIRNSTVTDVQRVAAALLDPAKMTVVLVGKPEGVTPDKTVETLPNVE